MSTELRDDPLPAVLLVLTATTGLVDAVSVLGLGSVFTANMTGNVVFSGFALAGVEGYSVPRSVAALVSFLVGAAIAGRLGVILTRESRRRWLLTVAAVEAGLLLVAALMAIGYDIQTLTPAAQLYGMIILTAVAMGVRNATVRQLAVPDLTTTVLTLTLAALGADSPLGSGSNLRWGRRVVAVAAIFLGAALGTVLVYSVGLAWPLVLSAVLIFLATAAYATHPASKALAGGAH